MTRYPAIFVNDILVAKPKDFGFYGKGEGGGEGKYTPWKDAKSHEKYRADLKRMLDLVLAGESAELRKETLETGTAQELAAMPPLELTDLSGKVIQSKDLAGRPVLVEFWATWCPPCRGTLKWLGSLKEQYGDKLTVIAIAIESDEPMVREVVNKMNLPIHWAMGSQQLAQSFGDISAVPTLFLFDSSGKTVEVFYGAPPDLHDRAENAIKALVQPKQASK